MTTSPTDRIEVARTPERIPMTGIGARPGPVEGDPTGLEGDGRLVAARAAAFVRELGAPGELGRLLARRAAVLSVRMDLSAERESLLVAAAAEAGRDEFDAARRAERAGSIAALRGSDGRAIAAAFDDLALSPEGLDHLIGAWSGLHAAVRSADEAEAAPARDRAALWLDAMGADPAPGDLADRVAAEVAAVRERSRRTRAALAEVIERARHDAGVAATFDTSPEAKQARRHEAAAERGFFRALRLIRTLRRDADGPAVESAHAEARAPLPPADDRPLPARPAAPAVASLGSIRAAAFLDLPIGLDRPASPAAPSRKARPDLRKLAAGRR